MKGPIVVNLFAGPGAGKSTTAAGVFCLLKLHNINAELVTEFAKDLTWENRHSTLANQFYVWGKQHHRLFRLQDQVDVIVTDSPLLLSLVYCKEGTSYNFIETVTESFEEFNNLSFFINRVKKYNPKGRNQTEEGAKVIDATTRDILYRIGVPFEDVEGSIKGINRIASAVLKEGFDKRLNVVMGKNEFEGRG